jgi:hypothetical protein
LIPGVKASSIYSSIPVVFDDSLATHRGSEPATVIVWLVPLVGAEPDFIRHAGWERFEDELARRGETPFWDLDPARRGETPFWDLDRDPIV